MAIFLKMQDKKLLYRFEADQPEEENDAAVPDGPAEKDDGLPQASHHLQLRLFDKP